MSRSEIEEMATQLLNISYDISEWPADFLAVQTENITNQIERVKEMSGEKFFNTNINLFELLANAYEEGRFEGNL